MKGLLLGVLLIQCTGQTCSGSPNKLYTIHTRDGKTTEVCGLSHDFPELHCIKINGDGFVARQVCNVESYEVEIGRPQPAEAQTK